jgi:hypothetical protein
MFTQKKNASGGKTAAYKLHSIHVLPDERGFMGVFEIGKTAYQFNFTPQSAASADGKPVLTGSVRVNARGGRQRVAEDVTATLLASQGSITDPPPAPEKLPQSLQPPRPADTALPITDATGQLGSAAVIYLRLSPLDARALGVPADLGSVQLNARMHSTSDVERDLHWLYSALVDAMLGESREDQRVSGILSEINRVLKA